MASTTGAAKGYNKFGEKEEEAKKEPPFVEQVQNKVNACCRLMYACFVQGAPPEPCEEVQELFQELRFNKRYQLAIYEVFHELAQSETEDVIKSAYEIKIESLFDLVVDRRRWIERHLRCLLELGGVEDDTISWNQFLYILLRFCSLNRVELCQTLFLIILKQVKSNVQHYITMEQMIDFYGYYARCPVTSFNTRAIDFTRLCHRRYYVEDFTETVMRFTTLLNPIVHLQRSLQEFLPSTSFWDDFSQKVVCRKVNAEFFSIEKQKCYLWGEPPFSETCEMLAPEALGFECVNQDQWQMRTFDLHERVGAMSEEGATWNGFVAPNGFQYRSLRQTSVWGEQPSPEETIKMMLASNEQTYMTEAGYITQHVDPFAASYGGANEAVKGGGAVDAAAIGVDKKPEDGDKKKKKKGKEKQVTIMEPQIIGNPVDDPEHLAMLGACMDEEFNAPIDLLPPSWMKKCAVAPAPRIRGPDPPMRNSRSSSKNQTGR